MGVAEWVAIGLAVLTVFSGIIGYLLAKRDEDQERELQRLREVCKDMEKEFHDFRGGILSDYVKRGEVEGKLERLETALFNKLDRIEAKLDSKADKP